MWKKKNGIFQKAKSLLLSEEGFVQPYLPHRRKAFRAGGAFYDYLIGQSCRFNDDDTAYLSKAFGSGNRRTWTYSLWIKRSDIGSGMNYLLDCSTNIGWISYEGDQLNFYDATIGTNPFTTAVYRDSGSWYNFVVVFDSTNGTGADRLKFIINGIRQVLGAFTIPLNVEGAINAATTHNIGRYQAGAGREFDGYLAEVTFIDGTAYTETDFGTSKGGVWIPKDVSGLTYGTNGFHLDFANSADLGNDVSGNNNDFTSSGLASTDQVADSPTNNYCVMNPLDIYVAGNAITFSEGNLKVINGPGDWNNARASFGVSSGKWYWEFYASGSNSGVMTGIGGAVHPFSATPYNSEEGAVYYHNNGTVNYYGGSLGGLSTWTTGDKIGIALDMDLGAMWVSKNGTWQNSATQNEIETGNTSHAVKTGITTLRVPALCVSSDNGVINFGQDSTNVVSGNADENGYGNFEYAPPAGFLALCSANMTLIAAMATYSDCATEDEDGEVAFTGNANADGTFVYCRGCPEDICVDGTHYDGSSANIDFVSNGIKFRLVDGPNAAGAHTLEYWLEVLYQNDFKHSNAREN
uniref:Putative tail fiber protein n=1 Tax=viral metagenome TaxID=1070528 RepID=A0A6M3IJT3_9ZZZZ